MPAPKTTLWPLEPHTRAKHEILRRYLEAWTAPPSVEAPSSRRRGSFPAELRLRVSG